MSAAARGISLEKLITESLTKKLKISSSAKLMNIKIKMPLITSKRSGHLKLANAEIEKYLG